MWPSTGNSPKSQIPCYGHRPLQCYSAIVKTSLISFASEGLHLIHSFPLLFASLPNFHKQFHLFFFFYLFSIFLVMWIYEYSGMRTLNIILAHLLSIRSQGIGNYYDISKSIKAKTGLLLQVSKQLCFLSCIKFGLHIMKISYICILQSDGE